MWRVCVALVVMTLWSVPTVAWAQDDEFGDDDADVITLSSQASTSLFEVTALLAPLTTSSAEVTFGAVQFVAYNYLKTNEPAVRQALAAGSGPAVDDLAQWCAVKSGSQARFARLLRQHRRSLSPLLDRARLNPQRAWLFFDLLQVVVDSEGIRGGRRMM